jgi:hypothetical protein
MATVKHYKPLYARIADGEYDVQPGPNGVGALRVPYSNGLRNAGVEIFVLSNEVAYSAQVLAGGLTGVIPDDLTKLRLPYPKVAFEFSINAELAALRKKQNAAAFGVEEDPTLHTIDLVGVYAEALPDGATLLQPYWRFSSTGAVEVCPLALVLNWNQAFPSPVRMIEMRHPSYPGLSVPLAATPSPAWMVALDDAGSTRLLDAMTDEAVFATMAKESIDELPTTLFSALLLINCKSGVSVARIPARVAPSGYGKRLKRKHSAPAYTVLALSEVESVSSTGLVSRKADLSAHYVRGHFKARKHGVYWWNSFIRGSGPLRKRAAYVVKE